MPGRQGRIRRYSKPIAKRGFRVPPTAIFGSDVNGATTEANVLTAAILAADVNGATTEAISTFVIVVADVNGATTEAATLTAAIPTTDVNGTTTEDATLGVPVSGTDAGAGIEVYQLVNSDKSSLLFNNVANSVTTAVGGANITGGFTVVAIVKKVNTVTDETITWVYPTWFWVVYASGIISFVGASVAAESSFTLDESEGWSLVAFTKANGSATPRFHKYVYGTGAWTHSDSTLGAMDNWAVDAPTQILHGSQTGSAEESVWKGNILISGVWGTTFSDGALEALNLQLGYQQWINANPIEGWRFDAVSGILAFGSTGTADQTANVGVAVDADSPVPWSDTISAFFPKRKPRIYADAVQRKSRW